MGKFKENWEHILEIDLNANTSLDDINKANFAPLLEGITTITPAASETADTTYYWAGKGYADDDVTGKAISFQISGHRKVGDPAQDYVAGKFLATGDELRTLARWTDPQGNVVQFVATLKAIVPFGGAANVKQTFSFTLSVNGEPKSVPALSDTTGTTTPTTGQGN